MNLDRQRVHQVARTQVFRGMGDRAAPTGNGPEVDTASAEPHSPQGDAISLFGEVGRGNICQQWAGRAQVARWEQPSDVPDDRGGWISIVSLKVAVIRVNDPVAFGRLHDLLCSGAVCFNRSWVGHGETLVATAGWVIVSGAIRIDCTTQVRARLTYADGRIACSADSKPASGQLASVALSHPTPPVGDWYPTQRRAASDHALQHHRHLYTRSQIWSATPEPPLPQAV